jgi:hypothetical protein
MNAPFKLAKGLRMLFDLWLGGGICGLVFYIVWMAWILISPMVTGKPQILNEAVRVKIGELGGNLMPLTLPVGNSKIAVVTATDSSKLFVSPWLFEASGEVQFQTSDWRIQLAVFLFKRILLTGLFVAILFIMHHFLTDAMQGTPFTMDNARRLKWLGLILLGSSLLKPIWEGLYSKWILSMVRVQNLSVSPWADGYFSIALILLACFILILSAVFRHGVELEQEHAATV